jgi:hypothetical protein
MTVALEKTTTVIEHYGPLGLLKRDAEGKPQEEILDYRLHIQETKTDAKGNRSSTTRRTAEKLTQPYNTGEQLLDSQTSFSTLQVISSETADVYNFRETDGQAPTLLTTTHLAGEAITNANLVTIDQENVKERVIFRETRDGDYSDASESDKKIA